MNTLAESLRLSPEFSGEPRRAPLIPLVDPLTAAPEVELVLEEARAFFAMEWPPVNGFTKIADTLRLTPDFNPRP